MLEPIRVLILGAGGRDFHNFNVFFRNNERYRVVAFTATQIPGIEGRTYPAQIAGPNYPEGIPILPETELPKLIREHNIGVVVFAYSDVSHEYVMHKASEALSNGSDFWLLGPESTMLHARVPVVAIGAVRTGSGKSQTSRRVAAVLREMGRRVVVVRHPMPYGDLSKEICQRFASREDLEYYRVTIEEREEYEHHIERGNVVYAGVDYEIILRRAEEEADVIIWDGGNNDLPFFRPNLNIVVADPLRPGHESLYHPGETNFRMADVIIINKVDSAKPEDVDLVISNAKRLNQDAIIIKAESPVTVDKPELVYGKKVLVVEDGPTLTHGEMGFGAGAVAARSLHAAELVDPRPFAVKSIIEVFDLYQHIGPVLPAMGYSPDQIRDLERTINATEADALVVATPVDLSEIMNVNKPIARVTYELKELTRPNLEEIIKERFGDAKSSQVAGKQFGTLDQ